MALTGLNPIPPNDLVMGYPSACGGRGSFAKLARKLVEEGVRFVQVYAGNWDSHDYIHQAHGHLIQSVDRPIAGLLRDLKRRGLLDETLVVFAGEFGLSLIHISGPRDLSTSRMPSSA